MRKVFRWFGAVARFRISSAVVLAITAIPMSLAQSQTVFFSPEDPIYRPLIVSGAGGYTGSLDYMDLFTPNAPWANAAKHIQVFEPYGQWIVGATDAQLKQQFADLARRNIVLGIELSAFSLPTGGACGSGVESFQGGAATAQVLQRIKNLGGNLQWVFLDNPLFYGSYYSGENACRWPLSTVLANVLQQLPIIRSIFPSVRIADIEGIAPDNVPDWLDRLKSFIDMYRQATGSNFAALRVDTGGYLGDWRKPLIAFSQLAAQEGIPFGIIYTGTGLETSSAEWMNDTRQHVLDYELRGGRPPDHVVFQSWYKYPAYSLPETDPSAFTSIINWYFRARTSLSVQVAAGQATGKLADSQGQPLASAPIQVTAVPTTGKGVISSYSITGTVPDGASAAVVGIRVNEECHCQGRNDISLYSFQYTENNPTGAAVTLDFSNGLNGWGLGPGTASVEPGPPPFGNGLHVTADASQAVQLNSVKFATRPGASFNLQITARVSPDSVGSGYFLIVFLTVANEGLRQTLLFQPKTILVGTASTLADGSFNLSLPPEDPNSHQVEADYAGNDRYWPAVATVQTFATQNSASFAFGVPLAPDMIAFGQAPGIAPSVLVASTNPWPTTLGGAHVDITDSQGQTRSAPIYFVTASATSFLIPAATALGQASIKLTTSTGDTATSTINIERASPGLYTANASGSGAPAGFWIRAAADGAQSYDYLFDLNTRNPAPGDLGMASDQVFLSLYGTGFRGASGATAIVGGITVPVSGFAAVGIYQGEDVVNIGPLPHSLAGRGQVSVVITFDGKAANTVKVSIK